MRRRPPAPPRSTSLAEAALMELAAIDLSQLCNEAKVESCRAVLDLLRCGREVRDALVSCGHASLCPECVQRCDACPICRARAPASGPRSRTRLYFKCVESGLVSAKKYDDGCVRQLRADVRRIFSFFDVALENNLVSIVCQYKVVVKDWCAWLYKSIVKELRHIFSVLPI